MGVLHSELPDDQLHKPKGFADAANGTVLCKNDSGSLQWMTKTAYLSAGMEFITGTISGTPTTITNSLLVGKSKAVLIVDNIFKGVFTRISGLDYVDGELSGITGLEDSQIYLIIAV